MSHSRPANTETRKNLTLLPYSISFELYTLGLREGAKPHFHIQTSATSVTDPVHSWPHVSVVPLRTMPHYGSAGTACCGRLRAIDSHLTVGVSDPLTRGGQCPTPHVASKAFFPTTPFQQFCALILCDQRRPEKVRRACLKKCILYRGVSLLISYYYGTTTVLLQYYYY